LTQKALGGRWVGLIESAVAWRHDVELDCLNEVLDLIRYALERSQQLTIPWVKHPVGEGVAPGNAAEEEVLNPGGVKMTEREKMLAGELYRAGDPELVELHMRARRLLRAFNQTTEEEPERRRSILRELLGATGERIDIEPPFFCDYGSHISVGDNFYMNFDCVILDCARVEIGENVMCGPKVQIYTATHPVDATERIKGPELAKSIKIGDNVWIGGGSVLCPGVTIGENTTIAAGSVVTKDMPPNVLAGGNPCRVLRELRSPES